MGLLTSFIFALVIIHIDADAFRQRRQGSDDQSNSESCPMRCMINTTQAWTKAVNFDMPGQSMLDGKSLLGKNETFAVMCTLYASYSNCVKGCRAGNDDYTSFVNALPHYSDVCTDQQDDFSESLPCLTNYTKTYRDQCRRDTENALAAATRLYANRLTIDRKDLNDYCSNAYIQLNCQLPLIRQTCGTTPSEVIRSIAQAYLTSLQVSLRDRLRPDQYPECVKYVEAVSKGFPSINSSNTTPNTTQFTATADSTTMLNTATTLAGVDITRTDPMRRDDAGSGHDSPDRLGGTGAPHFDTTTKSSTAAIRSFNFMAFIAFALVFGILK